jgi:hypothetical protein
MKMIISPAKSLNFETVLPNSTNSNPCFIEEAKRINKLLKKKSPVELSQLMHISDKLGNLNWERNQRFNNQESLKSSRPAVFAFNGDVYSGLDAYSLPEVKINNMQNSLRILSGLYGVLKPLDLIQPYRLEMGTKIGIEKNKNLYEFWRQKITSFLNSELEEEELFVNLASTEYFSVVDQKVLKTPIIAPQFKDFKNGKLKTISFYAKKARGMMVRYLLDSPKKDYDALLGFDSGGYVYSDTHTESKLAPVFIR